MKMCAYSMTNQIPNYWKTILFNICLYCVWDIRKSVSNFCKLYSFIEALTCHFYQFPIVFRYYANGMCFCSIAMISFIIGSYINTYNVSLFHYFVSRNTMYNLIVDRCTNASFKSSIAFERWYCIIFSYILFSYCI